MMNEEGILERDYRGRGDGKRDRGRGRRDRKPPRERLRRERDPRSYKAGEMQGKDIPTILAIQRRDGRNTSQDSSSNTTKSFSNSINSSLLYQKHTTSRHDCTPDQPTTPVQSVSLPVAVDHQVATGLAALHLPDVTMNESMSLIDGAFQWSDRAFEKLLDQNDFVVIGCVGLQGAGKSTVMSMIAGQQVTEKTKLVFRPQKKSDMEKCIHRTVGVDIYVTKERVILLDTQPLLSASMLEQYLRYDRKVPSDYATAEICLEVQALQILTFLYTVCHVVLVVQDYFTDVNLLNLLKTAEMLKPSTISHASPESSGGANEDLNEFIPHIVFVHTCCESRTFELPVVQGMCASLAAFFQTSNLRTRGSASIIRTPLLPYHHSKLFYDYQDLNLFLVPSFHLSQEDDEASYLTKYRGYPSMGTITQILRQQLLSMPRELFTHHVLSERSWFHYAARTWEAVKRSNLIGEYHRLLST